MTPTTNSTEQEEGWVECASSAPQVEMRWRDGETATFSFAMAGRVLEVASAGDPATDFTHFRIVEAP